MRNASQRNEKYYNGMQDEIIDEESEERERSVLSAAQRLKFRKGALTPKQALRLQTPAALRESKQQTVYTFGVKSGKNSSMQGFSEEPSDPASSSSR